MPYEQGPIVVPVINLNGTSPDQLIAECMEAREALRVAISALNRMMPHGRDYQTEPRGVYESAAAQHRQRIAKVQTIYDELQFIALAVQEQKNARTRPA